MKSIDRLVADHEIIERGLSVLERAVARIDSGQPPQDEFLKWAPEFFARFADRCHHAKEEDLFFPLLKQLGIPVQGGPIGVMLQEHEAGRDCVRRMREAFGSNGLDSAEFSAAANAFVPLLRQHIYKENNILFQMAANVLSQADDDAMMEQFLAVEQDRDLVGLRELCESELAAWEEVFG